MIFHGRPNPPGGRAVAAQHHSTESGVGRRGDQGSAPTLKTLARRSPIPVYLQVQVNERLPEPIEVSAYYVIAEALANAAKHARASTVSVRLEVVGDVLLLRVGDDGVGSADFTRGTGLVGIKDRVEAQAGDDCRCA